jgi:carboxyl-terminal processing protease
MDLFNRMRNEEMVNQDSIHLPDSLKYYTSAGRLVFGGGGIMPDFFVPADTLAFNNFYSEIIAKNLSIHLAFKFADQQRSTIKQDG